ncbi:MAG: DUF1800 domain-containing protein [Pseudomonadota bacterium]
MYSFDRQAPLGYLIVLVLTLMLAGCGGSSSDTIAGAPPPSTGGPTPPPATPPANPPPATPGSAFESRSDTARFLTQASFGPTPADLDTLTGTSASAWFQNEIAKPATLITPEFDRYIAMQAGGRDDITEFSAQVGTFSFWTHAIAGDDQLRQRMAFALSEILVVSDAGGEVLSDIPEAVTWYQDILRRNAFGNYRTLLEEVTYAPAMGWYLTYLGNMKADPVTGRMPDENYAREILQLFSIGLIELNRDGTPRLGANGQPIETYTNADVTGLARVFTGLDFDEPANPSIDDTNGASWQIPMRIVAVNHSDAAKTFLGTTIPEFTDAASSITQALNTIFAHPNLAPFVGRQLIQRFTTSAPSPAYVERVAAAFESGAYTLPDGSTVGTTGRGDLAATVAAILFDEEARSPNAGGSITFGKVREPILRFTAWARAFNVGTVTPELTMELWNTQESSALAQHPYRSASVFNFFRPGYISPGSASGAQGLTAPELQIVNASSMPGYANFMTYFATEGTRETDIQALAELFTNEQINLDPQLARQSFVPNYSEELALVNDPARLVNLVADKLTYGTLSAAARAEIAGVVQLTSPADAEARVHTAVLLTLLSPDFLVQR